MTPVKVTGSAPRPHLVQERLWWCAGAAGSTASLPSSSLTSCTSQPSCSPLAVAWTRTPSTSSFSSAPRASRGSCTPMWNSSWWMGMPLSSRATSGRPWASPSTSVACPLLHGGLALKPCMQRPCWCGEDGRWRGDMVLAPGPAHAGRYSSCSSISRLPLLTEALTTSHPSGNLAVMLAMAYCSPPGPISEGSPCGRRRCRLMCLGMRLRCW
mmetsp:Transcript_38459/g.85651  ORF Transcript_38459/g.85651 Transcript_38459/m.85651 type:complete len:212 (-) Transcript_38459:857-1492(-)